MPREYLEDDGIYTGRVLEWGFEQVGKNNTLAFTLSVELTHQEVLSDGGLEWAEMESPQRRDIRNWFNKPENVERSLSSLRSLGWDGGDDLDRLDPGHEKAFDFTKADLKVKVSLDESGDYTNENFRILKTKKAVASDVRKNLLAELKKDLNKHRKEQAKAEAEAEKVPF